MRRLRIVQIGMGHDHAYVIKDFKKMSDMFEVIGVAIPESDEAYLKKYNLYEGCEKCCEGIPRYSVEELLELPDIDAVVIETEELTSLKYAQMAADKGYHIQLDKPGSADHEEFKKLIETVKKNGTILHMGYMYRYNPAVMKTMKRIENGELGQIYAVEAHMDCHHPDWKRGWLEQFPGGMMFFLGCHLVDMIYRIKGEPEEILPMNCATGIGGIKACDYGFAVFKYKDGISFCKTCDSEPGGFMRRQLVICGSKETVRIEPWEVLVKDGIHTEWREIPTNGTPVWSDVGTHHVSEVYGRYDYMLEAFYKMVTGEIENPYSYDYELKLHEIVLKACGVKEV